MKSKRNLLWIIIPIFLAVAAGAVVFALKSRMPVSLELGEDGVTLYKDMNCTLRADKVYIGEDGRAYVDYTASVKGEDTLSVGFRNVEINGWAMYYHDYFPDYNAGQGSHSGSCAIAEADILERAGITDITDVRFEVSFVRNQNDSADREFILTVNGSHNRTPAARVPVDGEQILADTDDFTFIVETAGTGTVFGEESSFVQFCMENLTNKTLFADVYINSVNNLSVSSFCTVRLSPGAKTRLPVDVRTFESERFGMTTLDHIGISFDVSDKDSNSVAEYSSYEVYFNGYTADTLPEYTRRTEENETIIIDNDFFTFVIFGAERWDGDTYTVQCYFENKTDNSISFSTEESIINGIEVDRNIDGYGMSPHSKRYENMVFFTDPSDTSEAVEEFRFTMDVSGCDSNGNEFVVVSPDQWLEYAQ